MMILMICLGLIGKWHNLEEIFALARGSPLLRKAILKQN